MTVCKQETMLENDLSKHILINHVTFVRIVFQRIKCWIRLFTINSPYVAINKSVLIRLQTLSLHLQNYYCLPSPSAVRLFQMLELEQRWEHCHSNQLLSSLAIPGKQNVQPEKKRGGIRNDNHVKPGRTKLLIDLTPSSTASPLNS